MNGQCISHRKLFDNKNKQNPRMCYDTEESYVKQKKQYINWLIYMKYPQQANWQRQVVDWRLNWAGEGAKGRDTGLLSRVSKKML